MSKRRKKRNNNNAVAIIAGITAIIAAVFILFGCMVTSTPSGENKTAAAVALSSGESGSWGVIPDEYLYNTYGYDTESICEYLNSDLKLISDNLNSSNWFMLKDSNQMGEVAMILKRQFKYMPVTVTLSFIDTDGTIAVEEEYATFKAVFGIYTILQTTSGLADGTHKVESWEDVEKLVEQGIAKYEDFNLYDLYYTELRFSNIISTGFGHGLHTQESINKPWTLFEIWSKTKENKYITINKDCHLRYLTAAEENHTIDFAVRLDELGISSGEIQHTHNNYAAMSRFLEWLAEDDIVNGGNAGGIGKPDGDDKDDGDKDDGDITIKFPYPCHYCGYMIQNPDEILGHHCIKPPDEEDKPDDGDKDDGDEDDNDDKNDNPGGNENNDNENNGGDVEGDGDSEIDKEKNKFSFGHFSFENLKNLFNKDFWNSLFKGEIGIDWYGMFINVLYVIGAVAAVIILIKLIKRIGKAGNKK